MAIRKKKVPAVIHLMDDWLYVMKIHQLYKLPFPLYQMKDMVKRKVDDIVHQHPCIVMSNSLKQDFVENGFPHENLHLVYTGITLMPAELTEYPEFKDQFRLLYAGQVGYWKGVHLILEALRLLKQHDGDTQYTLDIIGDGYAKYLNDIKVYSGKHQLRVNLLGPKNRDELFSRMKTYHALVFPTMRKEPFGFIVVESMLAGCPVLASNIGGPSEIITHGETGLLFNVSRPVGMTNKIMQLSGDRKLAISMREKAYREAKNKYNFDTYIDRIEEILQSNLRNN
jgi:glycosyltransferase involved in cell wall biosynthesis